MMKESKQPYSIPESSVFLIDMRSGMLLLSNENFTIDDFDPEFES